VLHVDPTTTIHPGAPAMKKSSVALMLTSVLLTLTLSGCIAVVRHAEPPPANVTVAQQLIDLQKAKDAGVITESEFQAQRAKFLAQK
jgi:uncharacterized protein YceK